MNNQDYAIQRFALAFNNALIREYGMIPSLSKIANDFNLRAYGTSTISRETVRKWIGGLAFPEVGRLKAIIDWLKMDPTEFLSEHGVISNSLPLSDKLISEIARKIVDSMAAHTAILDKEGYIIYVNEAWKKFAKENGALPETSAFLSCNYLRLCQEVQGDDCEIASDIATGMRKVLDGELPSFQMHYPCHSPSKKRWFIVKVSLIDGLHPKQLIVSHSPVTEY
jgi:transcriptional regulator with XRE-family HTH domain